MEQASPPAGNTPDETSEDASFSAENAVRDLLAGEASIEDVVEEVAWSTGFPVETAVGTVLFVHQTGGSALFLAGSFNDWTPVEMNRGDGFFWSEVALAEPAGETYKFVDDQGLYFADPSARSYTYDSYGEISYVGPPGDTWRIDRWPRFEGLGLPPRDIRVYVPPGDGPWPVLYAQDGQNLFDPAAIWGGWRLQEALDATGPILVVGLDNTADRIAEYTHAPDLYAGQTLGGDGEIYARLLEEELRPHIERTYGTTGHDGLLGSSLGGLISLYIAHLYPDRYDFVASLSGTLGWGRLGLDNPVMEELYGQAGPGELVVYADSGGSDGGNGCSDVDGDGFPEDDPEAFDNYCTTRHFVDGLAAAGYTWNDDLFHWHAPEALHNEAAWSARVARPLEVFLSAEAGASAP